jgi:hypothetical protein
VDNPHGFLIIHSTVTSPAARPATSSAVHGIRAATRTPSPGSPSARPGSRRHRTRPLDRLLRLLPARRPPVRVPRHRASAPTAATLRRRGTPVHHPRLPRRPDTLTSASPAQRGAPARRRCRWAAGPGCRVIPVNARFMWPVGGQPGE